MLFYKFITFLIILSFAVGPAFSAEKLNNEALYNQFMKAFIYDYSGNYRYALKEYKKINTELNSNITDKDFFILLCKMEKFEEAEDGGLKFLEKNPTDHETLLCMAHINFLAQNHEDGLSYAKRAQTINPYDRNAYFYLGILYHAAKDYPKALEAFKAYHERDPFSVEVFQHLAELSELVGDRESAFLYYKKLSFQYPDKASLWWKLGGLKEDESLEEARKYYLKALMNESNKVNRLMIFDRLGNIAFVKGELEKAGYYFSKMIEKDYKGKLDILRQKQENANFMLAIIYDYIKDWDKALKYQMRLIKKYSCDVSAYLKAAEYYEKLGQSREAFRFLKKTLKKFPKDSTLNFYVGQLHYDNGRLAEAVKYFLKALDADPKNKDALYWIGVSYEYMNDIDKARVAFERVLDLDPGNMDAIYLLCSLYLDSRKRAGVEVAQLLKRIQGERKQDNLYKALVALSDPDERDDLEELVFNTFNMRLYKILGDRFYSCKDYEKAAKFYAASYRLRPGNEIFEKLKEARRLYKGDKLELDKEIIRIYLSLFFKKFRASNIKGKVKVKAGAVSLLEGGLYYSYDDGLGISITKGKAFPAGNIFYNEDGLMFEAALDGSMSQLDKYIAETFLFIFSSIDIDSAEFKDYKDGEYIYTLENHDIYIDKNGDISKLENIESKDAILFYDWTHNKDGLLWPKKMICSSLEYGKLKIMLKDLGYEDRS